MTDFLRLVVVFLAAVNPAAAAVSTLRAGATDGSRPRAALAAGAVAAMGIAALAVALAGRLLDFLEIAPESFRLGAGIVFAVFGAEALWFGGLPGRGSGGSFPALALVIAGLLAGPALLTGAVNYGADEGFGRPFGAIAISIAVAAALIAARPTKAGTELEAAARVTGALLIVVGVGLGVSGVRAI